MNRWQFGNFGGRKRSFPDGEEDPDEIDALLYSDSDAESEASTGHSPVVLSPCKKRRKVDIADTASSARCEDCDERKRAIKENVGVIRRLIPGWKKSKRKDALSVLDEAIKYLKSLRLKAKSFGVDSESL